MNSDRSVLVIILLISIDFSIEYLPTKNNKPCLYKIIHIYLHIYFEFFIASLKNHLCFSLYRNNNCIKVAFDSYFEHFT